MENCFYIRLGICLLRLYISNQGTAAASYVQSAAGRALIFKALLQVLEDLMLKKEFIDISVGAWKRHSHQFSIPEQNTVLNNPT